MGRRPPARRAGKVTGAASLGAAPRHHYCFIWTAVCIIWSAVVIVLALA